MGTLFFGIVAAIAVLGSAIAQYLDKKAETDKAKASEKEAKLYREKFEQEQLRTIALLEKQTDSISLIKVLNEKLVTAQSENINLSKELYNQQTGGSSICRMDMLDKTDNSVRIGFSVIGKYPINILSARVVDINEFNKEDNITFDFLSKRLYNVGLIYPNMQHISMKKEYVIPVNKEHGLEWNVFFSTNKGFFTQVLKLVWENGWKYHTKIYDDQSNKIIYSYTDKNFPEELTIKD